MRSGVAALATLMVIGWGCGGTGAPAPSTAASPFAWLAPGAAPVTWKTTRTAGGGELAYPPAWHAIPGDPGTASAGLTASGSLSVGYLNATPAIPTEVPSSWARFRIEHNSEEGDRDVRLIAAAGNLRFRTGTGACVIDSYRTSRAAYTEIACLVRGVARPTVIVAAAESSAWARLQGVLHRAIDAFRAQA